MLRQISLQRRMRVRDHGPEFVAVEFPAVPAHPAVGKQDRPRRVEVDQDAEQQIHRQKNEYTGQRADAVEYFLVQSIYIAGHVVAGPEQHQLLVEKSLDLQIAHRQAEQIRNDRHIAGHVLNPAKQPDQFRARQAGRGQDHCLDPVLPNDGLGVVERPEHRILGGQRTLRRMILQQPRDPIAQVRILAKHLIQQFRGSAGADDQYRNLPESEHAEQAFHRIAHGEQQPKGKNRRQQHQHPGKLALAADEIIQRG